MSRMCQSSNRSSTSHKCGLDCCRKTVRYTRRRIRNLQFNEFRIVFVWLMLFCMCAKHPHARLIPFVLHVRRTFMEHASMVVARLRLFVFVFDRISFYLFILLATCRLERKISHGSWHGRMNSLNRFQLAYLQHSGVW